MKKRIYVVETFYRAYNSWCHSNHFDDFDKACDHAYEMVRAMQPDLVYEEFYDAMDNGQTWCINNQVIGISDITPDRYAYREYVLLLKNGGICDNPAFLSGLSYPFNSMDELHSVMDRFVTPSGIDYLVMPRDEFAEKINKGELVVGREFNYLVYVNIGGYDCEE